MPSQQKKTYIEELDNILTSKANFILINFAGASHQGLESVRRQLVETAKGNRALRPDFKIVKNSLYKVAIKKKAGLSQDHRDHLIREDLIKGPSALITLSDDWLAQLKLFYAFARDNQGVGFKIGFIDQVVYEAGQLVRLSELPSFETLVAKILGSMKAPQSRLVMSLKFNTMKLVTVLKNKAAKENSDQKGGENI